MKYKLIPTRKFMKEAKRLAKKYPSLKSDLRSFEKDLSHNPHMGASLGNNSFKVRLAIKGKGKSGGARIIYYLIEQDLEVYLLTIYDKSELENVGDSVLRSLIAEIKQRNN